jgi:hypothetical protein
MVKQEQCRILPGENVFFMGNNAPLVHNQFPEEDGAQCIVVVMGMPGGWGKSPWKCYDTLIVKKNNRIYKYHPSRERPVLRAATVIKVRRVLPTSPG